MEIEPFDERRVATYAARATYWVEIRRDAAHEASMVESYLLRDATLGEVEEWTRSQLADVDAAEINLIPAGVPSSAPHSALHAIVLVEVTGRSSSG